MGWRDDHGDTPPEVLEAFRAARYSLDRWLQQTFPEDGDSPEDEARFAAWQVAAKLRLEDTIRPFVAPTAMSRHHGPSWSVPSQHERGRWRVVAVERVRLGAACIRVDVAMPHVHETIRYDFVKLAGAWRIDKVFQLMPDTGRAFQTPM